MFNRKNEEFKESPKEVKLAIKRFHNLSIGESSHDSDDYRYYSPSRFHSKTDTSFSIVYDQMINQFDCVICIEYCDDSKSNSDLSKKEKSNSINEYKQQVNKCLRYCAKIVHDLNLNVRLGVIGIPSSLINKNKVGQFEVSVIFKQHSGICSHSLHSKLQTSTWPSKGLLRLHLKQIFCELRVTSFLPSITDKFVEYISWESTKLHSRQWKCAKPSLDAINNNNNSELTPSPPKVKPPKPVLIGKSERPSVKRRGHHKEPQFPVTVEWIFDFRSVKDKSPEYFLFEPSVTLLPPSVAELDLSQLLSNNKKNKRKQSSENSCPPVFVAMNSLATFRLDEEQLRILGKRTSQRLLSSEMILRIPCGFDSLLVSDCLSLDCFVFCERPKLDPFVSAFLVIRHINNNNNNDNKNKKPSIEQMLLKRHSFTLGSPEGDWLGNFEVYLLPDPAVVCPPSHRYRFYDRCNDLLINHCLVEVTIVSEAKKDSDRSAVFIHEAILTDGTFDWPTDLKVSPGYCLLTVSSNSFDGFSKRLCICGESKIMMNKDTHCEDVLLSRKSIHQVDRDLPVNEILRDTPSCCEVIITSVPSPYELGTVVSFDIDEHRLKNIGGFLPELIARGKSTRIGISLEEKYNNNSSNLSLDALAIPYLSGKCVTVKIRITLSTDDWKDKTNFSNYGVKRIHLADLNGKVFETLQFELLPETSCRPPSSFHYFDKWRDRIVTERLFVEVIQGNGNRDIIDVLKGLVDLPSVLTDGEWTYSVHTEINSYVTHQCKFISYNNLRNPESDRRYELTCLLKPLVGVETPDMNIVHSPSSNLDCTLPKAIESGSVVEFLLTLDDDNLDFSNDFKKSIMDNKIVSLSVEIIKEVGSFYSSAVAIHKDTLFDGQYAIAKFRIEVKAGECLSHSSYGNMKILIGCPNGIVFKSHIFHLLPSFSLALVPSDAYLFYNKVNQEELKKEITISLFNNDNETSHIYKIKGTPFKWPDTIDVGFWKMEISSKCYETLLVDQLIYFNKFLIDETCPINLYQWIPREEENVETDYLIKMNLEICEECPKVMVCEEGYGFNFDENLLDNYLFNRIINDYDIVDLRFAIDDDDVDLFIEGLILLTENDGLVVKLFIYCDNIRNLNNYGVKTLLIADPYGDMLSSFTVEIQPSLSVRLPASIECKNFKTDQLIENVKCHLKFESPLKTIELFGNEIGIVTINLQDMEDGIWELVAVIDHYIPYRNTFVKYCSKNSEPNSDASLAQPSTITVHFFQTSTNSDYPKKDKTIPKDSVVVFPSHEDMFVDIVLLMRNGGPLRHMGSHRCNSPIPLLDFNEIPNKCSFSFTTFVLPSVSNEEIVNNDLMFGAYSDCEFAMMKGTKVEQVIKVNRVIVRKNRYEINPTFVDSDADIVKFKFIVADKFLCNTPITGSFTSSASAVSEAKEHQLEKKTTNSDGTFSMVLPHGKIDISLKTEDGNTIQVIRQIPKRVLYAQPGDGRPHFSINTKDNSTNSLVKPDQANIPSGCLLLYPSSPEVYVDICLVSNPTITELVYLGTFRSEHFINFATIFDILSESCEFHCKVFLLPHIVPSSVSNNDLRNGLYSKFPFAPLYNQSNSSQIMMIKEFNITMTHLKKSTTLSSSFVDVGLDVVKIKATSADKELSGHSVTGKFTSGPDNPKETIITKTLDSEGCLSLLLPEGDLSLQVESATKQSSSIRFWKRSRPSLESLADASLQQLIRMNAFFDGSKKIVSIPDDHPVAMPVIVFMDKSVSSGGNEMDKMIVAKAAMKRMFKVAIDKKISVALVAFDTVNYYCCPGINTTSTSPEVNLVDETNASKFRYLKMKDMNSTNSWIDSLTATKHHVNLAFALQDALKIYNECEDVYIIMKGTASPFTTSSGGEEVTTANQFVRDEFKKKQLISWRSFKLLYPKVKFNFVSLNNNETIEKELCAMSAIGNGCYNCTKNN